MKSKVIYEGRLTIDLEPGLAYQVLMVLLAFKIKAGELTIEQVEQRLKGDKT